jgi:hypothetical protein
MVEPFAAIVWRFAVEVVVRDADVEMPLVERVGAEVGAGAVETVPPLRDPPPVREPTAAESLARRRTMPIIATAFMGSHPIIISLRILDLKAGCDGKMGCDPYSSTKNGKFAVAAVFSSPYA